MLNVGFALTAMSSQSGPQSILARGGDRHLSPCQPMMGPMNDDDQPNEEKVSYECPVCGILEYAVGVTPDGRTLFTCTDHTYEPREGHVDRYTRMVDPPEHHFDYYAFPVAGHSLENQRDVVISPGWCLRVRSRDTIASRRVLGAHMPGGKK
jgi:hypothetical protein